MSISDKVSIIIPFLNAEATLDRCLQSVYSQTYQNWECILIDDGSSDNSFDVCRRYLNDQRFRHVVNHTNLGVATSRNIGLKLSRCEYIAVLDADDEMTPNRIMDTLEIFSRYPAIGILGGRSVSSEDLNNEYNFNNLRNLSFDGYAFEVKRTALIFGCPYSHSTVSYRRELFFSPHHLSYNPSYLVAHDYDLYRQISGTEFIMAFTDSPSCIRHETGNGLMDRLPTLMINETIKVKTQIICALLPDISLNMCQAIAIMLTYTRFISNKQANLCFRFFDDEYVNETLGADTYNEIKSRYDTVLANT